MNQDTNRNFLRYQVSPGWYLTPRDFMKLDFKKSCFLWFPRCCPKCSPGPTWEVGFRTWGGHSRNLRWKSLLSESRILHVDTIWFLKNGFPRVRAHLLEDALISETCPLEESALHHLHHQCDNAIKTHNFLCSVPLVSPMGKKTSPCIYLSYFWTAFKCDDTIASN